MWDIYLLPKYGELIVLNNFFYLELYALFFIVVFVYLFMKKYNYIDLLFIALSVIAYKLVTNSIFSWSCCSLQNIYLPTLYEINIFIWIITFWNILGWKILSNKIFKKDSLFGFIWIAYLISIFNEIIIQSMHLRIYSSNINSLLNWFKIFWLNIETFIYIFVGVIFMTSIYNYLRKSIIEKKYKKLKINFSKYFLFSVVGVLLSEVLLHPVFNYTGFPFYTYLYQDINYIIILALALVVSLVMYSVDTFLNQLNLNLVWYKRWLIYIILCTFFYIIIYSFLYNYSYFTVKLSWLNWWFNIFGLPIEFINIIILLNCFVIVFIRENNE